MQPTDEVDTAMTKVELALPSVDETAVASSDADGTQLSQEHKDYLVQRHGTYDLDPLPGMGSMDPHNWPSWKVSRIKSAHFHKNTQKKKKKVMQTDYR